MVVKPNIRDIELHHSRRLLKELYTALISARLGDGTYQQTTTLARLMITLAAMFDEQPERN
jgi:hypothetical protein